MIALLLLINETKVLSNIGVGDSPLQSFSQYLLPTDLEIFLCNSVKDPDSSLGVSKDHGFP
jgi:hypothetical protein